MAYVEPYYVEGDYFVPDDLVAESMAFAITVEGLTLNLTYGDIVSATTVTFTDKDLLL